MGRQPNRLRSMVTWDDRPRPKTPRDINRAYAFSFRRYLPAHPQAIATGVLLCQLSRRPCSPLQLITGRYKIYRYSRRFREVPALLPGSKESSLSQLPLCNCQAARGAEKTSHIDIRTQKAKNETVIFEITKNIRTKQDGAEFFLCLWWKDFGEIKTDAV